MLILSCLTSFKKIIMGHSEDHVAHNIFLFTTSRTTSSSTFTTRNTATIHAARNKRAYLLLPFCNMVSHVICVYGSRARSLMKIRMHVATESLFQSSAWKRVIEYNITAVPYFFFLLFLDTKKGGVSVVVARVIKWQSMTIVWSINWLVQ